MDDRFDVVIAGGGVMGASAAFWLTELAPGRLSVALIERDRSHAQSATALSVASIRQQFSNPVNVRISRFGIDFIRNIADWLGPEGGVRDLGLHEFGYLFLAGSAEHARAMREAVAIQRAEGATTELLDPAALARRFPWLETGDIVLGSFGPRDEGWFDNMGLLGGLLRAARARGLQVIDGEAAAIEAAAGQATAVRLASGRRIACGALINACGTRAAALLRTAGEDMPVEPRKRTVFVIDAPAMRNRRAPLIIDHSGIYLRPEGDHWLTAIVPEADGPCALDDFRPDHGEFEERIWPRLYARAEGFAAARVVRAWAGHYDFNRLDQNAIVGLWPGWSNLYVMNGFSGHGLQQAPAMGRGIAELILEGAYRSLDLSALGPDRVVAGTPFPERAIV